LCYRGIVRRPNAGEGELRTEAEAFFLLLLGVDILESSGRGTKDPTFKMDKNSKSKKRKSAGKAKPVQPAPGTAMYKTKKQKSTSTSRSEIALDLVINQREANRMLKVSNPRTEWYDDAAWDSFVTRRDDEDWNYLGSLARDSTVTAC